MALVAACCVVVMNGVVGLRSPAPVQRRTAVTDQDVTAVSALAEAFARVYAGWEPETTERRARELDAFGDVPDGWGEGGADDRVQTVAWTVVRDVERIGSRRALVTVTAGTSGGRLDLTVPVQQDARGRLFVPHAPAVVGPAPVSAGCRRSPLTRGRRP
jgi:hypothetical protein